MCVIYLLASLLLEGQNVGLRGPPLLGYHNNFLNVMFKNKQPSQVLQVWPCFDVIVVVVLFVCFFG